MILQSDILKLVALLAVAVGIFALIYMLFRLRAPIPSLLGLRGERRQRAVASGSFALLEPVVRQLGHWISFMPLTELRSKLERQLAQAGHYLGLSPDELVALYALSIVGFGVALTWVGDAIGQLTLGAVIGPPLGWMVLQGQLQGERNRRFREVTRQLPVEIDLAAMCMHAGVDFPGALRLIVAQRKSGDQVLREELSLILKELDLGHTRATALANFAARVPTLAVREFVGAVIQAEEKGSPLAEVLKIQATMLRMRRSVLAEEAASRAAALLMIPMVMLLGSVFIILIGPFIISSLQSELMQ